MLTSLEFLQRGQPWPPPPEKERLERYRQNRDLFEGRHDKVFRDWIRILRDDQKAALEIILNWPRRLSTLFADLLLGEPPQIQAGDPDSPEQATVQRYIEAGLFNTSYEAALDVSRFGVGLLKVRYADQAIIEAQTPLVWFPVVEPDNVKDVIAHVLAWDYGVTETGPLGTTTERRLLKVEVHERGRVTARVHEIKDGVIGPQVGEETVQETGVDDFLVVPIYNISTSDRLTGLDDYSDLDSIVQELEVRIAQISRILDKHADPNMYGPDTALQQDSRTGEWTFRGGGKYFPVAEGEQAPGYVTWNGQLDAAFKQVELLMEQFYALSETSAAAFGQLKSGLAESGTALRRLMMAPLAKVNRIRLRFDPALKKAIMLASALEVAQGMTGAVQLGQVHITWQDGLPDDDVEKTQIEVQRMTAGLTSLESALRRLDGLEGDALQEEVERIRAAHAGMRPAGPADGAPLPRISLEDFEGGEG